MMEILTYPNEILETVCEPVDMENPPCDLVQLKKDMWTTLKKATGLGLAANQVGLNYRCAVLMNSCTNNQQDMECMTINPQIVDTRKGTVSMWETCLSHPGVKVQIERDTEIRATWINELGKSRDEWLFGYTARAFIKNVDMLNGVSMQDHCIPAKWKEAVNNAKAKKT
tara:strand:+ start:1223 stop:1729 length:507 start_codon:yes stop_codon:yes gene_type:complete